MNHCKKYWKSPKIKKWYMIVVDGKRLYTIEDSSDLRFEKNRLFGLVGIKFVSASFEDLIRVRAKTNIPNRILKKMKEVSTLRIRGAAVCVRFMTLLSIFL